MVHAWTLPRASWNACQASMVPQGDCMCEIWLETSPYKNQPKQMTKYEVHLCRQKPTEANGGLPQLSGWQNNPQNSVWRPVRFHHGDPSDPMSQTLYIACSSFHNCGWPGAVYIEPWLIFAGSWSSSAFFDLNAAFIVFFIEWERIAQHWFECLTML